MAIQTGLVISLYNQKMHATPDSIDGMIHVLLLLLLLPLCFKAPLLTSPPESHRALAVDLDAAPEALQGLLVVEVQDVQPASCEPGAALRGSSDALRKIQAALAHVDALIVVLVVVLLGRTRS